MRLTFGWGARGMSGEFAIDGRLVPVRGLLIGIGLRLVSLGDALVSVRGALIGVRRSLIDPGGRLIGLPAPPPTPRQFHLCRPSLGPLRRASHRPVLRPIKATPTGQSNVKS